MTQIISIVGKSGSGKTTLIEKLIRELKRRDYTVGTVKHVFHSFDVDKKGKDSWRHMEAGADTVVVASQDKLAVFKTGGGENLDDLAAYFKDVDIVIAEGFIEDKKPKIEVYRSSIYKEPLCLGEKTLIALVTDSDIETDVPIFGLDETSELADFIAKIFLMK